MTFGPLGPGDVLLKVHACGVCGTDVHIYHGEEGSAGPGGKVLIFSVPSVGTSVELPLMDVFKKELKLTGSIINPDTNQRAADLIDSGRIEIKKLITHTFDIDRLEDAIRCQMGSESIKVIVKPGL